MTSIQKDPPPATHLLDCGCERYQGTRAFEVGTKWFCVEHNRHVWTVQINPQLRLYEQRV